MASELLPKLAVLVDEYFPDSGPCALCGDTTLGARHRMIDAIAELVKAGDSPEFIADSYGIPVAAVAVALAASWVVSDGI